jgi:hypothetical protein
MLANISGHCLNAQNPNCLTIDKTDDGIEKFIPNTQYEALQILSIQAMSAYVDYHHVWFQKAMILT